MLRRRTPLKPGKPLQRGTSMRDLGRLASTCACGKKCYATEEAAVLALQRIQLRTRGEKVPQRVYECSPGGWWHLTSRKLTPSRKVPTATRQLVLERDDWCCFCCGQPLRGKSLSLQHRDARGMGGSSDPLINSPANLVLLAGDGLSGCHGRVEQRGDADNLAGYWLKNGQDPAATPVLHWRLGPVLLGHDGSVTEVGRAA